MNSAGSQYAVHVKPLLADRLRAAGLDVCYHRAEGDRLYYRQDSGSEVEVLDMVGGFGASLLGHNHPEIRATVERVLADQRPFHAQASLREASGRLGKALADVARASTDRDYVITFANSGTEAVEAAIKHAEMERRGRVDAVIDDLLHMRHRLRERLRDRSARLPAGLFDRASRIFGLASIGSLEHLFLQVYRHALDRLDRAPAFIAVEGAFHGKTSGSVKLTHRPEYQAPWRSIGPQSLFVPSGDLDAVARLVDDLRTSYYEICVSEAGDVELISRDFVNIAACFVEPIQGEGGVREIDGRFLLGLRAIADEAGFPLVVDEIQSGMGRTGTFFAADACGLRGDYYLLSKALGGGVAKISALLIDRTRYIPAFGYVHTSTFAEDDLSSEVALTALELVTADQGALMRRCAQVGDYFLDQLRSVQERFPELVTEVRGRGLMIGIELASLEQSPSPMLRLLSEQELLGFVVSGYLLREEGIRVAPTLSARATIRIEPSAYIERSDIDHFCAALGRLLRCLHDADAHQLLRFVVGRQREPRSARAGATREPPRVLGEGDHDGPGTARVAFLGHFLQPEDLVAWDASLAPFSPEDCELFLGRTRGMIEPFVAGEARLQSAIGSRVHATILGLPFTPSQVTAAMRSGDLWPLELIESAVEYARRLGCTVVGFGGYTSIISNNCRSIVASDVALTSGNSLTSAAALDALFLAANRLQLERRVLGVLGAVGNIGQVLAQVASDDVDEVVLVGRPRGRRRLERAAAALARVAADRARLSPSSGGLAGSLSRTQAWRRCDVAPGTAHADGAAIMEALREELGERAPIRISTDMRALADCNLIITTTNSAQPVLFAEHVAADRPVVISDVALPFDVAPELSAARPNATVLRGGLVVAPMRQDIRIPGMSLRPGEIYGCLGETLLLGLAGIGENFSYGALDPMKVRRVRELARLHGFTIEENPV